MSSHYVRPKWWRLYLAFPLLITLFAVGNRLKLSVRGHEAVQIVIVLIVFEFVHLWLKANAKVLSEIDREQYSGRVTVIRIQPYQLPTMDDENKKHPMFQLPDSEIKGVLSNTFEMDYIDVKFISPLDEVPQELNKE
jgi:hypothetical protein